MDEALKKRVDKALTDTVNLIQVEEHARVTPDLNVVQSLRNQFLIIDLLERFLTH